MRALPTHTGVMMKSSTFAATVALLLAALASTATAAPDHHISAGGGDLTTARQATAAYHRVAAAEAAGYGLPEAGPLSECIASLDPAMPAAMGYHFINGAAVGDAVLDPALPEALVYEERPNGTMRLVALEYVVFESVWESVPENAGTVPSLFGRPMTYVASPNRYELPAFYEIHAWLWKSNPHGLFADHNPRVTCD